MGEVVRIIPEHALMGVTWWRLVIPGPPDSFCLYKYIGRSGDGKYYWFERRDDGARISLMMDQLIKNEVFGPFLLDLDKIEKKFQEVS